MPSHGYDWLDGREDFAHQHWEHHRIPNEAREYLRSRTDSSSPSCELPPPSPYHQARESIFEKKVNNEPIQLARYEYAGPGQTYTHFNYFDQPGRFGEYDNQQRGNTADYDDTEAPDAGRVEIYDDGHDDDYYYYDDDYNDDCQDYDYDDGCYDCDDDNDDVVDYDEYDDPYH